MTKTVMFIALLGACGSKSSQPAKPDKPADKPDEHGQMMPEIAKFHDVIAPRWHGDKDKQMPDTCAVTAELRASADAIAKAQAPASTDAAKWAAGAKDLSDAVVALEATCTSKDAAAFEHAFAQVHTHFHTLLEASGGEHHEEHPSEHEHHM